MATTSVSRIGIDENLPTGATYDLLFLSTPEGFPTSKIEFVFQSTPRKITGIQKVAQLFIKILFTQKGSDVIRYNLGTDFPNLCIGANRSSNDATFLASVSDCIKDAAAQTKNILNGAETDLASQLDYVTIQGLNTSTVENLEIYLQMTTLAGQTANVSIPFPELDMQLSNG